MTTQEHTDAISEDIFEVDDLPLETKEVDSFGKFRLQNQYIFLTYARCDFIDKSYKKWLGAKLPQYISCEIATEKHKDDYPHKHVLINRGKLFQTTNYKFFDFDGFHPNIKGVKRGAGNYATVLAYISKYDVKLHNLHDASKRWLAVASAETLSHALIEGDIVGLSSMNTKIIYEAFKADNKPTIEPVIEPDCPWYNKLKEYQQGLVEINQFRDILWFYDASGDSHKTHFANYVFDDKDYCVITSVDTCANFNRVLYNNIQRGWTMKYLVFLLPRNWIDTEKGAIYRCIETAKDGIITMTKYDSDNFRISQKVLIVVLSNTMPNIHSLTLNKWHLYNIHADKSISRISVTLHKDNGASTMLGGPIVKLNVLHNSDIT